MRTVAALVGFGVVFLALVVFSYRRQSATWDEPQHLVAGYQARALRDYRFDPEHPPFLRWWAALPVRPDRTISTTPVAMRGEPWLMLHQFVYAHEFLYWLNDADRLLYRARFMNALWGVLLGGLLFAALRERFGYWPALGGLALFTLEPNILAHAGLVTTDFGITCFVFGTVYFLWRAGRSPTLLNFAGITLFFVLAQLSKFTGILLVPIVGLVAAMAVVRRQWKPVQAIGLALTLAVVTYAAIWASYSFRYAPAPDATETLGVPDIPMVQERLPRLAGVITWLGNHRVLPNAYLEGFLMGQTKAQVRSAYLAGQYSLEGWWYFFPVAFLIKTPVALLALFSTGLFVAARRWRTAWADDLVWGLPIVVFLGTAIATKLNIGVRHILPIVPFVIVFATGTLAELWKRRQAAWAGIAIAVAAVELAFVYPHTLAFFNFTVGGPRQGGRYLVDSNLDWGQDLKGLKRWMDARQVAQINLSYFGTASPDYYGIAWTPLPGSPFFAQPQPPRLPGYVAISETNLRGVYFDEAGRQFYRPFIAREPVAHIGHSIKIYWVDRPWW